MNMSLGKYLGHMERDAGLLAEREEESLVSGLSLVVGEKNSYFCQSHSLLSGLDCWSTAGIVFISDGGETELNAF